MYYKLTENENIPGIGNIIIKRNVFWHVKKTNPNTRDYVQLLKTSKYHHQH